MTTEIERAPHIAVVLYTVPNDKGGSIAVCQLKPALQGHVFVVSSAVKLELPDSFYVIMPDYRTCETYLFPANPDAVEARSTRFDELVDQLNELDGSMHDTLDHEEALRAAGYDIIEYAAEIVQ